MFAGVAPDELKRVPDTRIVSGEDLRAAAPDKPQRAVVRDGCRSVSPFTVPDARDFVHQKTREFVARAFEIGFGACEAGRDGLGIGLVVVDAGNGDVVWNGETARGGGGPDLDGASVVCRENAAGLWQCGDGLGEP